MPRRTVLSLRPVFVICHEGMKRAMRHRAIVLSVRKVTGAIKAFCQCSLTKRKPPAFKMFNQLLFALCRFTMPPNIGNCFFVHCAASLSISARMSRTRQHEVLLPSLIGLGKRPSLTPARKFDLEMGIMGGFVLSPIIWRSRKNPSSGNVFILLFSFKVIYGYGK
jgi:hypothetical protein